MQITKNLEDNVLTFIVKGRIDTLTSPTLEAELNNITEQFSELIFDFLGVEYVSSACLRVLLIAKKKRPQCSITIVNANDVVKEVFEITGFDKFLNII